MLRFLSDEHAKKVAKAMWDACMNNNIGYCQAHRSIMAMLKKVRQHESNRRKDRNRLQRPRKRLYL